MRSHLGIVSRHHCHGTADTPHLSPETSGPQKEVFDNKVSFKEQDLKYNSKGWAYYNKRTKI